MFKDLSELAPELYIYIQGEAEYFEDETDYHNGTGITAGWSADIYGLTIEIYGHEYTIPADALPAGMVQALREKAQEELNNDY